MFHVSQLKKHLGPNAIPVPNLPLVNAAGKVLASPVMVLDTRAVPRHPCLVTQWLVQWVNMSPEEATWEDADFIKNTFPVFYTDTIRGWFPSTDPRGQGLSSVAGSCQDPASTGTCHLMSQGMWDTKERNYGWD